MSKSNRAKNIVLLTVATLAVGLLLPSTASAGNCTGTWFEYYESSAFLEIVGAKVSCPGFPDQIDTDPDGNYVETPFFTTETTGCPCSGGGGGGGGEDEDEDGGDGEGGEGE